MRYIRLLFPVAIIAILAIVAHSYINRLEGDKKNTPPLPPKVPANVSSLSKEWHYMQTEKGRNIVEVSARNVVQQKDSSTMELEGVELHIFNKADNAYDKVKSEKAQFNTADGILTSDGDVEITLGVPENGPPKEKLLVIKTSGVRYESKTGKATTDRDASFTFDRGNGKSVGASYDPTTKELVMKSQVELHWRSLDGKAPEMMVQTGELHYKENESKVYLSPWSKLVRGTMTLNGGNAVVALKEGQIDQVDAEKANGTDTQPEKKIDYAADHLHMQFADNGEVQSIEGKDNARIVSHAATTDTTITAQKVNMDFATETGSSLQKAVATGQSVVEAKPVVRKNVLTPDTKVLRSETVEMTMRPNGQEIDHVVTPSPGTLEFLPNRPGQRKRTMNGEHLDIRYGDDNLIRSFHSVNVSTRTENEPKKGQKTAPPSLTWSKELSAEFDQKTGELAKLEQWNEFRYEEGDRKAKADHATLDQATNNIDLTGSSKVWDASGSTAADHILLLQKTNEMRADGNVISLRLPDQDKKKADTSLLAQDQPLQAKAQKMTSAENNSKVHYEGNAILWQGVNRLQCDAVDINRKTGELHAMGHVISQFVENDKEKTDAPAGPKTDLVAVKKEPPPAPVYTVIRAPELTYNDKDRIAHYTGGVLMSRAGLDVKSQELRAFLKQEKEGDSSLDHAFADGKVDILQRAVDRTRHGTSEHAEYYVDEEKVFLEGGSPQMEDSVRGTTKGKQLTYWSNNDRLLVDGESPKQPAVSSIKRKKKK